MEGLLFQVFTTVVLIRTFELESQAYFHWEAFAPHDGKEQSCSLHVLLFLCSYYYDNSFHVPRDDADSPLPVLCFFSFSAMFDTLKAFCPGFRNPLTFHLVQERPFCGWCWVRESNFAEKRFYTCSMRTNINLHVLFPLVRVCLHTAVRGNPISIEKRTAFTKSGEWNQYNSFLS